MWARLADGQRGVDVTLVDPPADASLDGGALRWTPRDAEAGRFVLHFQAGALSLDYAVTVTGVVPLSTGTVAADGSLEISAIPTRVALDQLRFSADPGAMPAGTVVTVYELIGPPLMMPEAPGVHIERSDDAPVVGTLTLFPSSAARSGMGLSESAELTTALYDPSLREWAASSAGVSADGGMEIALGGADLGGPPPPDGDWKNASEVVVIWATDHGAYRHADLIPVGSDFRAGDRNCLLIHGILSDYSDLFASTTGVGSYALSRCDHVVRYRYGWGNGAIENGLQLQTALAIDDPLSVPPQDGGATFTVFAHSNGGLITRSMMEISGGTPYPGQLDALVTLDTPHEGGEIVRFPDLLADLDPFPVDGVQDLLARTLDDPDSLLSLLRSEPIGDGDRYCFAAVNMVYDPTRTDGVVSEESALAPCDESRRRTLYDADEMWDGVLPDVAGTHSWIHQEFLTNLAWVQADSWLAWGAYAPACSNGVDDDEDGWIDLDDPGCAIGDERAVGHDQPRNDGVDDDGDGLADSADPTATTATAPRTHTRSSATRRS